MPNPAEWQLQSMERKLFIRPQTAIAVLEAMDWLSSEATNSLESLLVEIRAIAQGD